MESGLHNFQYCLQSFATGIVAWYRAQNGSPHHGFCMGRSERDSSRHPCAPHYAQTGVDEKGNTQSRGGQETFRKVDPQVSPIIVKGRLLLSFLCLTRSEWSALNLLCVGFGQQICSPVGPKCSDCLNKDLCPSSSCLVNSSQLPLGMGFEMSTKSKGKKAKSNSASAVKTKKIKIEK